LNPFLSIIIPAHNEERRLPGTLAQIFEFLGRQSFSAEVLVVENGSSDATHATAQQFAEQHPNLRVIQSARGKGAAVRTGMLAAQGDYRFMCDADLSMPVDEIAKFIPTSEHSFDIAIASREAPGSIRFNEPAHRHIGGRVINFIIQLLILPGLNDTQCGFKCFSARAATEVFAIQSFDGWSFDIEALYIARRRKLTLREIPIHWYYDADTKVSAVRDAIRMVQDILHIRANAWRGRYDPH
jgi:dolichyl-phosphate beta-glucosyltransferase